MNPWLVLSVIPDQVPVLTRYQASKPSIVTKKKAVDLFISASPGSADNKAQVVSTSWGKCEALLLAEPNGAAFINALHSLFQQAAAQGQSVFAATGDTGSEDCYDGTPNPPSEALQVDSPGDDPFVTAVGGTALERPGVEPVWNDCGGLTGDSCAAGGSQAAGGGQSIIFKRPSWMAVASNATTPSFRGVPDISGNAGVGETFYDNDASPTSDPPPNRWTAVGGTSIAAPMMAGFAADIAQGCKGGRLGNFTRKLNALAAKHVYKTALTDVTTGINWTNFTVQSPGSNDLTRTHGGTFRTTSGYDLASGFGVPIAAGLSCPEILSMTPNHRRAGTRRHAARCRSLEGDDQVRIEDRQGRLVEGEVGRRDRAEGQGPHSRERCQPTRRGHEVGHVRVSRQ